MLRGIVPRACDARGVRHVESETHNVCAKRKARATIRSLVKRSERPHAEREAQGESDCPKPRSVKRASPRRARSARRERPSEASLSEASVPTGMRSVELEAEREAQGESDRPKPR